MPLPVAVDKVTFVAEYVMMDGTVPTGTVTFDPNMDWVAVSDVTIVGNNLSITLDATGAISIEIPVSDDPDYNTSILWNVTEHINGFTRTTLVVIPYALAGTTVKLKDLVPSSPPGPGVAYLTRELADLLYDPLGGGSGTLDHQLLINRDLPSQHPMSAITDLDTTLAGKAESTHSHVITDTTDLATTLAGKAASTHSHAITDVTDLVTTLAGKAASAHSHAIADVTDLQAALDDKLSTSGVAGIIQVAFGGSIPGGTPANTLVIHMPEAV